MNCAAPFIGGGATFRGVMQSHMIVQNPQATMPLRIPLTVDCNTSEDKVLANVLANSRNIKTWVSTKPAHSRIAVMCGGGPSLADTLDEVLALNGDVFALNGAAAFLNDHGIRPAYQVIMDAQPETLDLVGPADHHLFASQVDPQLFERVPSATLWHATFGDVRVDEQPEFPEHDGDYCLIGAAVSVGNTALVLLYALGYRTIHVFGMDSSHKDGKGHAYAQPMNDGDPCTIVTFRGREYTCSISMELQARNFRSRAAQLSAGGCKIVVHGDGLLPAIMTAPDLTEVQKYEAMWSHPEYRDVSPGEQCAAKFLAMIPPKSTVIDFGCGTGRAGLKIERAGHIVTLVDFTDNCRDAEVRKMTFTRADLTKPLYMSAQYGFCTDVLEHIPPDEVATVIDNIMDAVRTAYFQISTVPDAMGALIGAPLHLTVKPHAWWKELFSELGYRLTWEEEQNICSSFMVTKENAA